MAGIGERIQDFLKKNTYDRLMADQKWHCKTGKFIGSGGFGRVFELEGTHDGGAERVNGKLRKEVVKIIDLYRISKSDNGEDHSKMVERGRQEIKTMNRMIDNGYTAQLLDFAEIRESDLPNGQKGSPDTAMFFLIMPEYGVFPKDTELPQEKVIRLGCDICEALKGMVAMKKLHRDLKPRNIFYDNEKERYILGDFGIANEWRQTTNTSIGRDEYCAPELYDFSLTEEVWTRLNADLYSLAVVMARFLGCPANNATLDFKYFQENNMACPALLEIIEKGIKPYNQRYQTPAEMQADLRALRNYVEMHGRVPPSLSIAKVREGYEDHAELAREAIRRGDYRAARAHSQAGCKKDDHCCTALLAYSSFHLIRQGILNAAERDSMEKMLTDAYTKLQDEAMGTGCDEKTRKWLKAQAASIRYLLAVSRYERGDSESFVRLASAAADEGNVIASYVCGRGMYAADRPFARDEQRGLELLKCAAKAEYGAALAYVRQVREQNPGVMISREIEKRLSIADELRLNHRLEDILRGISPDRWDFC